MLIINSADSCVYVDDDGHEWVLKSTLERVEAEYKAIINKLNAKITSLESEIDFSPGEEEIHVIPDFTGEPVHETSTDCWCEPQLNYEDEYTGRKVWAHRRPE